jgi:protein ImuB
MSRQPPTTYLCLLAPCFALQAVTWARDEATAGRAEAAMPGGERRRSAADVAAAHRPQAAIVETPPTWTVLEANAAARAQGVDAGLPVVQAQARSPRLECLPQSLEAEAALQSLLRQECERSSPLVEELRPGIFLLDLRGLRRLKGTPLEIAGDLLARLRMRGVHAHCGIAATRAAACMAAAAQREYVPAVRTPNADSLETADAGSAAAGDCPDARRCRPVWMIPAGEETQALAPLPVALLAKIVGDAFAGAGAQKTGASLAEMLEILERWGIRTLSELAALPARRLAARLGQPGLRLQTLARGESDTPLLRAHVGGGELMTAAEFDPPVEDGERLRQCLLEKLQPLCAELERSDRITDRVRLRLVTGDTSGRVRAREYRRRFLVGTQDARAVARQLTLALEAHPPDAPVHALQLFYRAVRPRRVQQPLFGAATPDTEKLAKVLDRIAELLDDPQRRAIGSPRMLDSYRDDAFELVRDFSSPEGERDAASPAKPRERALPERPPSKPLQRARPARETPAEGVDAHPIQRSAAAWVLRRFRPPLPVRLAFMPADAERPGARASTAPISLLPRTGAEIAFPTGKRLHVRQSAGPWRSSGEWWSGNPWGRDEWDVELENGAVVRLARDFESAQWTITGVYD